MLPNCNDRPWTSSYPVALDASNFAPGFAAPLGVRNAQSGQDLTPRAQRSIRMLSEELPEKLFTNCKSLATFSIHKNPIETKDIQGVPNFKEYNERRVQKYDKQIYGGAMKENLSFDEGFDKEL